MSDGTAGVAFLDRLRPDVVHVHGLAGLPVDLLDAAATRGIPVLLTAHDALDVVAAPGFAAERDALVARVAARVGRCHAPSALAAGVLGDAGLPAAMLDVVPQPDDEGAALAAYADALEAGYRGEALPGTATTEPIAVRWTGDHESATSLATINRAVCASLAARPGLSVERREIDGTSLDGPRERPPALEIRHRWPPDFAVPPVGRLALIQPWEYGALPTAWDEPLRHSSTSSGCRASTSRRCTGGRRARRAGARRAERRRPSRCSARRAAPELPAPPAAAPPVRGRHDLAQGPRRPAGAPTSRPSRAATT